MRHFTDPTMTQTFLGHFNCRDVSDQESVLQKDYDVQCGAPSWWIMAAVSIVGLAVVSIGFPVGMAVWMRAVMADEERKIRLEGKDRAAAYRDFNRKFSYISVSLAFLGHRLSAPADYGMLTTAGRVQTRCVLRRVCRFDPKILPLWLD